MCIAFGNHSVSLKKEVTAQDWLELVDAIKAKVDTDLAPLESDRETQTTCVVFFLLPSDPLTLTPQL